ncbi:1-acylglycerol-3-phosphate O-acyltransferase [Blochmannia endosymbiont of Polyrhachis (Hedomyrma) turneri]|uniref:1-acylglycerol-3-phosphate O-acyltransferase n=1 Tax=Blochmannia endosymbiont of Polyrhachis (Hedomyrma) turneri TaxID=1505596 RepID=UPI00061A72CE|nr:1-acylglycerol-3-phosphate O-acyltransferase [Blochmannia endosymbiont of Polyrhachis (Hedomyrma) turneri]AKC59655.1 1-acyl-sn-glycerol-3-phosphate acyltransferase [Blochmannia endosymbiont of Polyrhachis (Hedomyrma) turneri]
MLAVVRMFLVVTISIIICIFGVIYCLFNPRDPSHVSFFGRLFGCMAPIFGIQVEIRQLLFTAIPKNCIYVANHQNNYDMVTVAYVVQPRTITVGKRSLLWIPLFGLLYWLSGNLLINRSNSIKSHRMLYRIIQNIKKYDISVCIFPEGTRSRGRGLLPFKKGAFYAAISAGVPIVPICVSNLSGDKIRLNRWSNGSVIIEILPPIETTNYTIKEVDIVTDNCYILMKNKIEELNQEVMLRDSC